MKKYHYSLLLLSVGIMIGYVYNLDMPQALEVPLRQQPYSFSTTQFNLLYFSTFLLIGPLNVPLGIIIDRFPIKPTMIFLLFISLASQLVIALMFEFQPQNYKIYIMVLRSLFGLAGQGMFVVQCLIVTVFSQGQYEFIMGAALSIPFLFDSLNSLITTAVYDSTQNLTLPWYIGSSLCMASLLLGFIIIWKIIGEYNQNRNNKTNEIQEGIEHKTSCLRQLKTLSSQFWVLIITIFFCQACLGPVNDNLNELLVKRFSIPYATVGKLLLIPMGGMAFFVLIVGAILRKNPTVRRVSILSCSMLNFTTQLSLYFLPNTTQPQPYHYFMVTLFLLSFSLFGTVYYASLTTAISFLVQDSVLGTAWGLAGSSIGFVQCIIPLFFIWIMGEQSDLAVSYSNLNLFMACISLIPFLLALWIYGRNNFAILDTKYQQPQLASAQSLLTND